MAQIQPADIKVYYSTKAGSAGNTLTSTPTASLGKYISQTLVPTGAENLFLNASGAQNAAQEVHYRCVFVLNNHSTSTAYNALVYLDSEVAGGGNIAIATDNLAPSDKGSASAQAWSIATETTAPTGATSVFSSPTAAPRTDPNVPSPPPSTALVLGNLAPGQVKAVWVRRSLTNSAALADGFTLATAVDTGP
jgi:hypothetical protein